MFQKVLYAIATEVEAVHDLHSNGVVRGRGGGGGHCPQVLSDTVQEFTQ